MMKTLSLCVIGHPIGHTMSPFIHTQLFNTSGVSAEYTAKEITPNNLNYDFKSLKLLDGFNATIPFKQQIIPLLDRLDESALLCGAVNTVYTNGETVGYNTDMHGFEGAIKHAGISLSGDVLICGTGGAARAVAFSAAMAECNITIAVRQGSEAAANALCDDVRAKIIGAELKITHYEDICNKYDLAINATPVGMYPNVGKSVLTEEQICRCGAVYDLIYNPEQTELLRIARKHGIKCDSGMSMLVMQAAKAHEIWYGATFSNEQINQIIADAAAETKRIFAGGDNS